MEKQRQKRWQEKYRGILLGNDGAYDSDNGNLHQSSVASSSRPMVGHMTRKVSIDELAVRQSPKPDNRRWPLPANESQDSTQMALQNALAIQIKRASFKAQKKQKEEDEEEKDEDTPKGSSSDTDSEDHQKRGSYDFFDVDPPLPPPPPSQDQPDETLSFFFPPPSLSPTASLPTSPLDEITFIPPFPTIPQATDEQLQILDEDYKATEDNETKL